ncbi:MAG: ketol-acid reductoisomerase, partial [Ignavibacteriales bacterium]|nr:ketol-acid reductoisomerase [Ignavibacteriales bacterium]
ALKNKKIAIIGYGSQGHAHALNLKDNGMDVIVAEVTGSPAWEKAVEDGFKVVDADTASKEADVIMILLPDQVQKKIYDQDIAQNLTTGKTLIFAHGFNIHYKQIVPPTDVNVIMIAPKGPGHLVRRIFTEGKGVPSLIAIEQDYSGNAKDIALAWAKGIGSTKAGVIETTFKNETETDLFGEQAVLCGGSAELIKAGFETLVEAGYPPELAYFECMHEMKLIVDLYYEGGLSLMNYSVSDTAEYGGMSRGKRIIKDEAKKEMKKILQEVQDGSFAKEWLAEYNAGMPNMEKMRKENREHKIEEVGAKLREMMSFIMGKNRIKR